MIPGLNSNIRHEGKIFHIQTEDSGVKYGHVISHLFLEGVILASVKTSYPELLELPEDEREPKVADLMRKAHRTLVRSLTSGNFDEKAGIGEQVPKPEGAAASMTDIPLPSFAAPNEGKDEAEEADIIEETVVEPDEVPAMAEADPNSPLEIARKLENKAPDTQPVTLHIGRQIRLLLEPSEAPNS